MESLRSIALFNLFPQVLLFLGLAMPEDGFTSLLMSSPSS